MISKIHFHCLLLLCSIGFVQQGFAGKTKRAWAKIAAKGAADRLAFITQLQNSLNPGEKLLTCPYCRRIVKVPECQQMLTCLNRGQHPGEIKR